MNILRNRREKNQKEKKLLGEKIDLKGIEVVNKEEIERESKKERWRDIEARPQGSSRGKRIQM